MCPGRRRLSPVRLIALVLAASAALGAPPSRAASPAQEAEALIQRANELRTAGDDQAALPLFQRALKVHPSPRTLAQLGLVENALGRWADADEHITAALRSPNDPWIARNLRVLEDVMRQVKLKMGRVEITGEPMGADVLVNGRLIGKVPLAEPVRVNEGSVDVELRAEGYRPMLRTLNVEGRQYQQVVIRLERIQPSGGPTPPPAAPPADHEAGDEPPPSPGAWRPWAIVGAATGAAIGLGVGFLGRHQHNGEVDRFNKAGCFEAMGKLGRAGPSADDVGFCSRLRDSYTRSRTLSFAGFGAAAALGTAAVVLYLTTPDAATGERTAHLTCAPQFLHRGLACAVVF